MTTNILFLESSPRGDRSYSIQLARELIEALHAREPTIAVTHRDLNSGSLPTASGEFVEAIFVPPAARTPAMREAVALSDRLVDELIAHDVIVIAAPIYNYTVPANLKLWIDQIVRPGLTFAIEDGTYRGLLENKTVYVVTATGGVYSHGPGMAFDFHVPYLKYIMGFIGISDVRIVRAEQAIRDPETALAQGRREIVEAVGLLQAAE